MQVLEMRAGPRALAHIREHGLKPQHVRAVSAASGGPKWLILSGFDQYFFGQWLAAAEQPITLTGSSIGAWRMAMQAVAEPEAARQRFLHSYIYEQRYPKRPTPAIISAECERLLDLALGEDGPGQAVANPQRPLRIIANRMAPGRRLSGPGLYGRLLAAALANRRERARLGRWVHRSLFESEAAAHTLATPQDLPTERFRLMTDNLRPALLASGAIPGVMEVVHDIPGGSQGTYLDGGLTDYHPALPEDMADGIRLFPHFYPFAVPGWFDKRKPQRRNQLDGLDNTLIIAPSNELVASLPHGKIPDRKDFYRFSDAERIAYWEKVVEASERMGEAFVELSESNQITDSVRQI
ncbi:patatin-like phospholipase family protein [Natronospira bacteriovora]|uniref:Patatin-like phospholipase family protein n=1 Tax=Natronospira bacteriovora TaxID=3069753 RepID=A0ABU0W8K1_9GAMM|nr:patatin-like phospholipase family protein [Natronospira sp. AB-CW4]MDQ2070326.1 patatin-like phospholipase family protein [Natronospira sp. AB-CW4]